jgi:hypothetical protein
MYSEVVMVSQSGNDMMSSVNFTGIYLEMIKVLK